MILSIQIMASATLMIGLAHDDELKYSSNRHVYVPSAGMAYAFANVIASGLQNDPTPEPAAPSSIHSMLRAYHTMSGHC